MMKFGQSESRSDLP